MRGSASIMTEGRWRAPSALAARTPSRTRLCAPPSPGCAACTCSDDDRAAREPDGLTPGDTVTFTLKLDIEPAHGGRSGGAHRPPAGAATPLRYATGWPFAVRTTSIFPRVAFEYGPTPCAAAPSSAACSPTVLDEQRHVQRHAELEALLDAWRQAHPPRRSRPPRARSALAGRPGRAPPRSTRRIRPRRAARDWCPAGAAHRRRRPQLDVERAIRWSRRGLRRDRR